jgi:hypothetical protein
MADLVRTGTQWRGTIVGDVGARMWMLSNASSLIFITLVAAMVAAAVLLT